MSVASGTSPPLQPIDATLRVPVPEQADLELRLAGPGVRGLAWAIDASISASILTLLVFVAAAGTGSRMQGAQEGVIMLLWFVMDWLYFAGYEFFWRGQTPGKRLFGLRAIRNDGLPLTLSEAVLRNFARTIDWLPAGYAFGLATMAWSRSFTRLGDLAAGTVVVREAREVARRNFQLPPPPKPEELVDLPARLALPIAEVRALEHWFARGSDLSPARRAELVAPLVATIEARFGLPRASSTLRRAEIVYHLAVRTSRP